MTTSFFIVRHGESTWNAARRWQGRSDPPLSERGEAQARAGAARIDVLGPLDGIVTSTLARALRTGTVIADVAGLALDDPLAELAERSAGPWEGLTRDEIEEQFPGFLADGSRPDGYESDESVVARALGAIELLAADRPDGRWLVVSHGGVIHALERYAEPADDGWQRLDNLEGRWFEFAEGELRERGPRIHLLAAVPDAMDVDGYA